MQNGQNQWKKIKIQNFNNRTLIRALFLAGVVPADAAQSKGAISFKGTTRSY